MECAFNFISLGIGKVGVRIQYMRLAWRKVVHKVQDVENRWTTKTDRAERAATAVTSKLPKDDASSRLVRSHPHMLVQRCQLRITITHASPTQNTVGAISR